MYIRYIKRILDIVLSFVGLILSSWLFLIIIAAIGACFLYAEKGRHTQKAF